jgi:hypothetical protein
VVRFPFPRRQTTWWNYVERLKQYFEANEVDNTKKVSSLLTLIGGKTYSLLRDLTFPDKPSTQTYDQLTQLLNNICRVLVRVNSDSLTKRFCMCTFRSPQTVLSLNALIKNVLNSQYLESFLRCAKYSFWSRLWKRYKIRVAMDTAVQYASELQGTPARSCTSRASQQN